MNELFEKASDKDKRIAVCLDAIWQADNGVLDIQQGVYYDCHFSLSQQGATCTACAVGGVFAGQMRLRHGELTEDEDVGKAYTARLDAGFDHPTLDDMECVFESGLSRWERYAPDIRWYMVMSQVVNTGAFDIRQPELGEKLDLAHLKEWLTGASSRRKSPPISGALRSQQRRASMMSLPRSRPSNQSREPSSRRVGLSAPRRPQRSGGGG